MNFAQKLKNIRIEQGLSQKKFATMLDIGYSSLLKHESGVGLPDYSALKKMCEVFPHYALNLISENIDISTKQIDIKQQSKQRIKPKKEM